jgi:very-short-patch-repair endonuclease
MVSNFSKGCLGSVLGIINTDFIYNVGDIVRNNNGKLKILEQINKQIKNKGKRRYYKYKCLICENEEVTSEELLYKRKFGCPVCSNKKCIKGINDIVTTHPHFVKYFVDIEDAYKYTYGSGQKVLMICPECKNIRKMKICQLTTQGFSCKKCSDGISYPNKFMFNILEQLQINFESEKYFDWCKFDIGDGLRDGVYDFYIPSINKIIEMDGGLHNNDNTMNGQTAEESKVIDNEKDKLAKENNIEVIRIDCDYGRIDNRFEYIKNNVICKLNKSFNLNHIDWLRADEFSISSRVKEVCNLWNIHKDIRVVEVITKLNITSVISYLKKGYNLGFCNYKTRNQKKKEYEKEALKLLNDGIRDINKISDMTGWNIESIKDFIIEKGFKNAYYSKGQKDNSNKKNKNNRRVICLTTNEIFESIASAQKKYKDAKNIFKCANGLCETSGTHLTTKQRLCWMDLDKFNSYNTFEKEIIYRDTNITSQVNYIKCINTSIIYSSSSEACRDMKITTNLIKGVCDNKRKYCGIHPITNEPLEWEYATLNEYLNYLERLNERNSL